MLSARRIELLNQLAKDLEEKYCITTRTVQVDLSEPESIKKLEAETNDLEIGLLINNAGKDSYGSFLQRTEGERAKLVQLNSITPMELAHLFGNKMAKRGKGGIIFVASTLGYSATPYFSNYSATKAYILSLGEGLHYELKKKGVDVLVLSPGLTDTAMPAGIVE